MSEDPKFLYKSATDKVTQSMDQCKKRNNCYRRNKVAFSLVVKYE